MSRRLHKQPWLSLIDPRMTGRTHVMAEAAKRIQGTFVCHSREFADRVRTMHGVATASIGQDFTGTGGILIYDHLVVQEIEAEAFRLQAELDRLGLLLEPAYLKMREAQKILRGA